MPRHVARERCQPGNRPEQWTDGPEQIMRSAILQEQIDPVPGAAREEIAVVREEVAPKAPKFTIQP